MADYNIKKLIIDGNTYYFYLPKKITICGKDFDGSADVTILPSDLGLSNALHFIGETTTALSDGSKTSSIQIGSTTHTAATGDVVLYNSKEFVWQGSEWRELGDGSSHALKTVKIEAGDGLKLDNGGTLASDTKISHADTSSQTSISASTSERRYITGVTLDGYGHVTGLATGTETVTAPTVNNGTLTIQKNGANVGTFTANQSGNTTANITVPTSPSDIGASTDDHIHTVDVPSGVSSTFTGASMTSTGKFTPSGTVSKITHTPAGSVTITTAASTTGNYTPAGSVSKPNITVSPTTSSFLTSASLEGKLEGKVLTLSVVVDSGNAMTSATAALASTPSFTGTKVAISGSFAGTEFSVTPTFSGTEGSISVSGTTTGSVSSSLSGTTTKTTSTPK